MIVVWEGPSRFTGEPIFVGLTFGTENRKTGPMVQSWVLRADQSPVEALQTGGDEAICGSCPRRGGRGCYVLTHRAPRAVWNGLATAERVTPEVAARRISNQMLRIGAYGDPAAVPASLWWTLVRHVSGHTGYTHSPKRAPALRELVMASVESEIEAIRWQAHGWRTYRVRSVFDRETMRGEITCPASKEAGKRTACAYCLKCNGAFGKSRQNIVVSNHSGAAVSAARRKRFLPMVQR